LTGINFVDKPPLTLTVHWEERKPVLYELYDILALTNFMLLSCPSCGVTSTLLHSMKAEPPSKQYR
jgi:hypothetical protein